jgi:catechol 2,3-dioxygenase-like lactoylglutathione lyase family enzyme
MRPSVHISLTVRDLDRAVDFYRRFFGEPAKLKADYAKFVTQDPEIHLALAPGLETDSRMGALSHLGIRVGSTDEVERWRADLGGRGLIVEESKRSECCYALQDKFWLTDPDGNRWEIYTVLEDVERMAPEAAATCCPSEELKSRSSCCTA